MSGTLIDRILNHKAEEGGEEESEIVIARPRPHAEAPWEASAPEGELAVDVFQTEESIVVIAVIGGVSAEGITVEVQNDVVTLRGVRYQEEEVPYERYLTQECYWGPFSRTMVLPVEVRAEDAIARFRQGILRIELPKVVRTQSTSVQVVEEGEEEDMGA